MRDVFFSVIFHASIFLYHRILLPVSLSLLFPLFPTLPITIFITAVGFFYHQNQLLFLFFLNADIAALYPAPLASTCFSPRSFFVLSTYFTYLM